MESPATPVRKGRGSTRGRNALPTGTSHQNSTATVADEPVHQPSSSAPTDCLPSSSFSFEISSPTVSKATRARVAEGTVTSSDDPDSKGGRSLRKRPRTDSKAEQVEESMSDGGKAPPSTRVPKRRRTDSALHEKENGGGYSGAGMKRRSSEQIQPPSSARRRSQAQKPTVNSHHIAMAHTMEEVEVQDTIEVGGHQSEQSDVPALKRACSDTSFEDSMNDQKRPRLVTPSGSMPTSRKFHLGSVATDLHDLENDVEQPKEAQSPPPEVHKNSTHSTLSAPYEYLTPYIDGEYVEWPYAQAEAEPGINSQLPQQDVAEEIVDDQLDGTQLGSNEADTAPEDSLLPDRLVPADSTPVDDALEGGTPVLSPLPIDTIANSPAADAEPSYTPQHPSRPILFKKTRDASEFLDLFKDYKTLSTDELWRRLEVTNHALVAWQDEHRELRYIVEDERNAIRYRQHNASYEHRLKMQASRNPGGALPEQPKFIIRGIRAPRLDAEILYARDQDRLMATNYDFDYDENVNKIGFQDPLAQKSGGKGRLRERPKQTAKAAEADDGIVLHGKRTRKPPVLFDGSEAASNRSTPAPTQRRRRKTANTAEDNSELKPAEQVPVDTSVAAAPPKKKGKGGRPRKHPLPAPILECPPAPADETRETKETYEAKEVNETKETQATQVAQETPEQPEKVEEEKPTRKGRRTKTAPKAPIIEEETHATNGDEKQAQGNTRLRRTDARPAEVPSSSFYTSSMQPATAVEESRPPTSSSTATQSTVASNYQLREKRQKVFTLNPNEEGFDEVPKAKRARRSKKNMDEELAAAAPLSAPTPSLSPQRPVSEPTSASKPPPKIKLKNYNGHVSSAAPTSAPNTNPFSVPSSTDSSPSLGSNSTSNGAANGTDPTDTKDYKQMTKSEKMSQSMKARWASGSMSQAVAKRRATLANKKQAVRANEPGQLLEVPSVATKS
ncbi:hypothetical protein GGS21DRAFT_447660 [Xylaria nigripes]|nr:hypothetical protein GGS21DRAFT_447660 [Xylaria nigripes]